MFFHSGQDKTSSGLSSTQSVGLQTLGRPDWWLRGQVGSPRALCKVWCGLHRCSFVFLHLVRFRLFFPGIQTDRNREKDREALRRLFMRYFIATDAAHNRHPISKNRYAFSKSIKLDFRIWTRYSHFYSPIFISFLPRSNQTCTRLRRDLENKTHRISSASSCP